ncbi:helix-turn-helix domain-containing protein [Mesorhizobium sp. ES1-4]|uniref:helix-turn-helix domain-containing protein n=1 Tax=Mesorhizobium sp. ES1-4 TaxID=2876627 RepID=UPI001CCFE9C8|nr:helix-turn-helix domain-containing protein [Mesorhizobium sp. ES1-4]MBZ9795731.1 helix-turn-helix domain-containing protein [Mesorhizobium sp. ES1-4]
MSTTTATLTVQEAANLAKVPHQTVHAWIKRWPSIVADDTRPRRLAAHKVLEFIRARELVFGREAD